MINPVRTRRRRDRQRVLTILALNADRAWSAAELASLLGMSPIRTWMALGRLADVGAVTSRWEDVDGPRPRRRLYQAAPELIDAAERYREGDHG